MPRRMRSRPARATAPGRGKPDRIIVPAQRDAEPGTVRHQTGGRDQDDDREDSERQGPECRAGHTNSAGQRGCRPSRRSSHRRRAGTRGRRARARPQRRPYPGHRQRARHRACAGRQVGRRRGPRHDRRADHDRGALHHRPVRLGRGRRRAEDRASRPPPAGAGERRAGRHGQHRRRGEGLPGTAGQRGQQPRGLCRRRPPSGCRVRLQ